MYTVKIIQTWEIDLIRGHSVVVGIVVFVRDEVFEEDEEDDQDGAHDARHKTESGPRSIRRVQIGDTYRTQDTSQTGASTQDTHPSALYRYKCSIYSKLIHY